MIRGRGNRNVPLTEGVAEGRGSRDVPLTEGVAEGRGRPAYRKLYNPNLQPIANTLRGRMTKAEACLWKYVLRAGRMKGYTFNRQRPVLRYVADFMCKPLNLIIELDGTSHNNSRTRRHDAVRQRELESCGFSVLRFADGEVLHSIESVCGAIEREILRLEAASPGLRPPPPKGDTSPRQRGKLGIEQAKYPPYSPGFGPLQRGTPE